MRYLVDVVDGTSGRALAREQRRRTLDDLHAIEIGRIHDAAGHLRGTDLDPIVERVDLGTGKAPHRERRRRPRRVAGRDANRSLRRLRGRVKTAILDRLLVDHLDRRGNLAHREPQSGSTFGDNVGVKRGMENRASARGRRWRSHGSPGAGAACNPRAGTTGLRPLLGSTRRLSLWRRDDDRPETAGLLCLRNVLCHDRTRGTGSKEGKKTE